MSAKSGMENSASPNNENQDPNLTPPRSPARSPNKSLRSPAGNKSMWDSGDPNRNPPPLPASPQMVRVTGKNKNCSPNSVGKLQFATVPDTSEIEHQLERILNAQSNLRSIVVGVDTSVKQTQLDLESLVERSSNNNSHLRDLVENVKSGVTNDAKSSTDELQTLLKEAIDPIHANNESHLKAKGDILEKLNALKMHMETPAPVDNTQLEEVKTSVESLSSALESIKAAQVTHLNAVESLQQKLSTNNNDDKLQASVTEIKDSISDSLSKIESQLGTLDATKLLQTAIGKTNDVSKQLAELKMPAIDALQEDIKSMKANSDQSSNKLEKQLEVIQALHISKFDELNKSVGESKSFTEEFNKLEENVVQKLSEQSSKSFESLLRKVQESHESQSTSYKNLDSSTSVIKEFLEKAIGDLHSKHDTLGATIQQRFLDQEKSQQDENIQLQLQLKDKEIEQLKKQLADEQQKNETQADILELTKKKAKIQAQFENLNKAYIDRFNEFKQLTGDYDALQSKLSNISLDKIKNIHGSAAMAKLSNDQMSTLAKSESPRKNPLGTRVLSTNSYLNNNEANLTPRSKKNYEFGSALGDFEEKENF